MKREPRAWVLNLDAEHELEAGGRYAPTRRMISIVGKQQELLVGTLVAASDVILREDQNGIDPRAVGLPGYAWCPTPRALARLASAGAHPIGGPPLEVLRLVNARPFATRVRRPLIEGSFDKHLALTLEEALSLLGRPTPNGWLVRRTFGAAGRGRRRVAAGSPDEAERAWLAASLRLGPLTVEPWVEVTREYTCSAWLATDGGLVIGPPCFQETTEQGAWTRTELAAPDDVGRSDGRRLEETMAAAGEALHRAGYFGPFGIDAYRHRVPGASGAKEVLNPMSEINARFTMDWASGLEVPTERSP